MYFWVLTKNTKHFVNVIFYFQMTVCNGSEVNSIEEAQKLKDCSKIIGVLVIQIMGGSKSFFSFKNIV